MILQTLFISLWLISPKFVHLGNHLLIILFKFSILHFSQEWYGSQKNVCIHIFMSIEWRANSIQLSKVTDFIHTSSLIEAMRFIIFSLDLSSNLNILGNRVFLSVSVRIADLFHLLDTMRSASKCHCSVLLFASTVLLSNHTLQIILLHLIALIFLYPLLYKRYSLYLSWAGCSNHL